MAYVTDGAIGVDLDSPASANAFNGSRTVPATMGETHEGSEGSEWLFVMANSAISRGDVVAIDNTTFAASSIVSTSTLFGKRIAFAQTAFATSQFGYVALRGNNLFIRVTGSAIGPGVPLYTTDTAGCLSTATASASAFQVWGVFLSATVSGTTASAGLGVASFPMIRRPG